MATPVTLVLSSDPVLGQRALEGVIAEVVDESPDVVVQTHVGSELEGLPELRTRSLFGGATAVVVLQAETLPASVVDEAVQYVAAPDPDARLVLVAAKPGRAKRVVDAVRTLARKDSTVASVVTAEPPPEFRDQEWRAIVRDEFARHRRRVDERAVDVVLDRAGFDVAVIAGKVAQVVGATTDDRQVTADDVEDVLSGYGRRSGFAIADACVARDQGRALALLRGALDAGDEPVMLLGGLVFRLRQLLQVRSGMTADELGMAPYPYKLAGQAARRFGPGELGAAHRALARADVDLKGSDLPAEVVLELAVMAVAGG